MLKPYQARTVQRRGIMAQTPMKLKRGTFTAIFFLACIAALELEGMALDEI
jgi:hypothetical protein